MTCLDENCKTCVDELTPSCYECKTESSLTPDYKCVDTVNNCQTYSIAGACMKCNETFTLLDDGTCAVSLTDCTTIDPSTGFCSKCTTVTKTPTGDADICRDTIACSTADSCNEEGI